MHTLAHELQKWHNNSSSTLTSHYISATTVVRTALQHQIKILMSSSGSRWASLNTKRNSEKSSSNNNNSKPSGSRTRPLPVFASLSSGHGISACTANTLSSKHKHGQQDTLYDAVRSLRKIYRNHASMSSSTESGRVSRENLIVLCEACQRVATQLKETISSLPLPTKRNYNKSSSSNKQRQTFDGLFTEAFLLLLHSLAAIIPKDGVHDDIDVDAVLRDLASVLVDACSDNDNDWLKLAEGQLSSSILLFSDCFQKLADAGTSETKYLLLQCTSNFIQIKRFSENLKGEETSSCIVQSIFLPILEQQTWSEFSQRDKFCILPLNALLVLIQQHHHASALLAPLVIDVSESGEEKLQSNPLRLRLLTVVLDILLDEYTSVEGSGACCNILASLVDAISHISGHVGEKMKSKDDILQNIDVPAVARKINLLLQFGETNTDENIQSALKLLSAISRGFPQAICGYWYLFFPESTREAFVFSTVSRGPPPLLTLMKSNMSSDTRRSAILTAKDLLKSLPLHLWMGIATKTQRIRYSSSRTLSDRVRSAMTILIDCVLREMEEFDEDLSVLAAFCLLSGSIISHVPVNEMNGTLSSATRLVQIFGDLYTKNISEAESSPTAAFILESLGGVETQAGTITPLPLPTEIWLERNRSLLLLLAATFNDTNIKLKFRLQSGKMLAQILRMAPWLAEDNSVSTVVKAGTASKEFNIRHGAASVLLRMLQGRDVYIEMKRVNEKDWTFVFDLLCENVFTALCDSSIPVKIDAIKIFGSLLGSDWDELDRISSERSDEINSTIVFIGALLDLAEKGNGISTNKSDEVSATACKSLADICTNILRRREGQKSNIKVDYICQRITDAMISIISSDAQASVKCMVSGAARYIYVPLSIFVG
mmetsp:Transcript_9155/g.13691  ORF Transcript_9155/g.13691 Transcript_9155/m.13691 type:complete len:887 (-) Transcript_9155:1952-4612(-)